MPTERHSPKRWFIAGALVLSAHVGVAAALGSWTSSEESAGGPQNTVLIDMVAFAPDTAAVAQAEPEEERKTEPDEPEPERLPEPEPGPVPEPEPEPVPEPEPEPKQMPGPNIDPDPIPELPKPDPQRDPVPKPEPVPDEPELVQDTASQPQQLAAAQQPVRQPEEAAGHTGEVVTWKARLASHLERHKRYPRAALRRNAQGTASVRFAMTRSGKVQTCSLVHSSGHESLDTAACEMVLRAQPLPSPPEELPDASLEMTVPVDYWLR